jgi:hypothetical protein
LNYIFYSNNNKKWSQWGFGYDALGSWRAAGVDQPAGQSDIEDDLIGSVTETARTQISLAFAEWREAGTSPQNRQLRLRIEEMQAAGLS